MLVAFVLPAEYGVDPLGIGDATGMHVFNLGLGMLAVVPPGEVSAAIDALAPAGHDAFKVGAVVEGDAVRLAATV